MVDDITPRNTNDNSPPLTSDRPCEGDHIIVLSRNRDDGFKKEGKCTSTESAQKPRFHKIEANHHHVDHNQVYGLLGLLNEAQRLALSVDEKKLATFFIDERDKKGVQGGAVLIKKQIRNRQKNRGSHYAFQGEKLWTCYFILQITHKDPLYMSGKRRAFCRAFYEDLYDTLLGFGREVDAPLMWVTLDPEEYSCVEALGNFPFMVKIKPQDAIDGLFHGLLALSEDLSKACVTPESWSRPPRYKLVPKEPKKQK